MQPAIGRVGNFAAAPISMSKHRTPESLRVVLKPHPWTIGTRRHTCANCNVLQNLLDGAMAKIERLEREKQERLAQPSARISPTARAARMQAEHVREVDL